MVTKQTKPKIVEIRQPYILPQPPRSEKADQEKTRSFTRGSDRSKRILEVGALYSADWVPGVSGFALLARGGLIFGAVPSGTFPPGAVDYAAIGGVPTARLLGRTTAGTGAVETISIGAGLSLSAGVLASTITQYTDEMAQDAVGAMVDTTIEYVDATPLLRRAALTGDVTAAAGSNATTIANDAVTNAKAANMAQSTIKGRAAGAGTGDPTDLTPAQVNAILDLDSGTYSPTRSAEANLDASITFASVKYYRVGSMVTVAGRFTANPTTTATPTSFEMTLPVASNIGAAGDVSGTAFNGTIQEGAEVIGVAANDTAKVQWVAIDTTSTTWSFQFTYRVI